MITVVSLVKMGVLVSPLVAKAPKSRGCAVDG